MSMRPDQAMIGLVTKTAIKDQGSLTLKRKNERTC
jgi:hypothetical protein